MITCKQFPDKTFATKEEVFAELRENAERIIALKKAPTDKSINTQVTFLNKGGDTIKIGPQMKDGFCYPVINTTKYMDSHDDVHFDGIWTKSIKEQQGKLFYVADHTVSIDNVIAWPEDVNAMVKSVPWSFIGENYTGNTEALIFEIDKAKIVHPKALQIINEKRRVQNSVRMQYVKVKLAMNSDAKDDVESKAYYDSRINDIANKDVAEAQGYFFGVEEAKIVTEGSMVIFGSNGATPIRQKIDDAGDTTSETIEPPLALKTVTQFINPNLI